METQTLRLFMIKQFFLGYT